MPLRVVCTPFTVTGCALGCEQDFNDTMYNVLSPFTMAELVKVGCAVQPAFRVVNM